MPPSREGHPPARRRHLLRLLAWVLGCLVASTGLGATYDPDLTWRTIVTEHYRIHFHQGEEQLAEEFSQMVERVHDQMTRELSWKARMKVDVVLIDQTDRANGFASAVPYNQMTIFVTAPQEDSTLSLYEDWNAAIFTHELTHVLHIETHGGIVAVARAVVGRVVSTNDVSPPWMVEGLATLQETRHTAGGRGRNPYVDMIKRAAFVDDAWPPLGNLDGLQAEPPGGNLRYLFGQDFMQYIADTTGENVWTRWTHAYGRSVPWALFLLPPKRVFGARIQQLYRRWTAARHDGYERQIARIAAEGVIEGELISDGVASCTAPAFSPDDRLIVWSCNDRRTGNALWRSEGDGSGARILKQDFGAKSFTWRSDSQAFVYAATHIVNRFNTWSDVFLFDLETKRPKSLTAGARARDPDFSPDGRELVMVTNAAQDTRLEILTVDGRRTVLTDETDHTQYATPRWAPNGQVMAVSIWERGRRDLWILDRQGRRLRRLMADVANDRDPRWSADGRWLLFSSDRSGVPNIYAVDTTTERLWQVTNVRTGAARPSANPSFTRLVYEQYSADGWDVRLLDLDPARFLDRGLLPGTVEGGPPLADLVAGPRPQDAAATWTPLDTRAPRGGGSPTVLDARGRARPQSAQNTDTFEQIEVEDAFGEEQDFPFTIEPRRYDPAPAMLPRYWFPSFSLLPRLPGPAANPISEAFRTLPPPFEYGGFSFNASTSTTDPLRRYAYSLFAYYRSDADDGGGGGTVTINRWLPVFSLGVRTDVSPFTYTVTGPWGAVDADGDPRFTSADVRTFFMRSVTSTLAFSYPFTPRSTVFANYRFRWRVARDALEADAYEPSVALQGTFGDLTAGYRYSWQQQTARSISPEDARAITVSATLTGPFLGTFARDTAGTRLPITQLLLSVDWREFLVNPLAANHVFVLKGGAGVAFGGANRFLGNFQLGGNGLGVPRAVRGYPFGAVRGDSYWLVGAAYRLPLWRMDRGFGTVPLFFRYLSAEIFAEAGNAFDSVTNASQIVDGTLVGVGVELRLNTFLLWGGTLDLRVGYGVGVTPGGYFFDDPRSVYVLFDANL